MSKKSSIYVEVDVPIDDTQSAMVLIEKFFKKNNISMNLSIAYDYSSEEAGVYRPFERGQEYRIFVNPSRCKMQEEVGKQDYDEPYCPGYCADITLFGVTIHEFCHLLQYQVYHTIIPDYGNAFPIERFNLNGYSNHAIHDELAEIMTLYITNPFLLKLISRKHFNFCKKYFKPVVSCTEDKCAFIYKGWPVCVKEHLKKVWGITFNVSTQKFVRIDNGKTKEDTKKSRKKSSV